MKITLAAHYGMCFGVRDALRTTHDLAATRKITILGELVHNPVVSEHLATLGVAQGDLTDPESAPTRDVVVTAHGASDRDRRHLAASGFTVADTTCPLVRKAHDALARLAAARFHPVVIGKRDHVEVRGLTGDFPEADVVLTEDEIDALPFYPRIGVIAQTTQPLERVVALVNALRTRHRHSEVRFVDTVCQPTKDRQSAVEALARENELVIVVGGPDSNNTRQLVETARKLGARSHRVATPAELNPKWFRKTKTVGLTAGTSTLEDTVTAVHDRIRQIATK